MCGDGARSCESTKRHAVKVVRVVIRALIGWGDQRHTSTNRQVRTGQPAGSDNRKPHAKFNLSLTRPLSDDLVV
jgi:hypothetical protein